MTRYRMIITMIFLGMLTGCQNKYVTELENDNEQYKEIIENQEMIIAEVESQNSALNNTIKDLSDLKNNLEIEISTYETDIEALDRVLQEQEDLKHPYEIALEEEMTLWNGNTSDGVQILVKYGDLWKIEMNKYYDLLYEELEDDRKKFLQSSQQSWEDFYIKDEELDMNTYYQVHQGGTIISLFSADDYYERYHKRALELKIKYETIRVK